MNNIHIISCSKMEHILKLIFSVPQIAALERARRVEELQKKLEEADLVRARYNRKVCVLKDAVRCTGETFEQERNSSEHQINILRDDLARTKEMFAESQRREAQLQSFR